MSRGCLEAGPDTVPFRHDLEAAARAASRYGLSLESLVFPLSQYTSDHLSVCREAGITAVRGAEPVWIYRPGASGRESTLKRAMRLLDTYLPVTRHNTYSLRAVAASNPRNIASTRFLRPYYRRLAWCEPLKLHRIVSGLRQAARAGEIYHLWWHPHNFGVDQDRNFNLLGRILEAFATLRQRYGMESLAMREVSERAS